MTLVGNSIVENKSAVMALLGYLLLRHAVPERRFRIDSLNISFLPACSSSWDGTQGIICTTESAGM